MMPCNRTVHFRPWRFFASCLAFVLAFAALVKGHGYLSYPAARNINDYCKQCLNGGGGALVNAGGGYAHGMCGNSKDDAQQTWNVPGGIQATYVEGQAFDIAVVITAHHMGYFALELCDTPDITEECFARGRSMRPGCAAGQGNPDCYRAWKTLAAGEAHTWAVGQLGYSGGTCGGGGETVYNAVYKSRWQLPQGVTCSHCVLRWRYYTTNSCPPENPNNDPTQVSEEFFNCADISIVAASGETRATGPASAALVADLLSRQPVNLRPLGLGWQCPERALGGAADYNPVTALTCCAPGLDGVCQIGAQ